MWATNAFLFADYCLATMARATASRAVAASTAAGGATAAASATGQSTTTLWRVVQASEAADIATKGIFRNLGMAEGKYFATSEAGALSYAKQAADKFPGGSYTTLVRTEAPVELVRKLSITPVDRNVTAYVIPDEFLPALRPEIVGPVVP
jgi:hypothetical protein